MTSSVMFILARFPNERLLSSISLSSFSFFFPTLLPFLLGGNFVVLPPLHVLRGDQDRLKIWSAVYEVSGKLFRVTGAMVCELEDRGLQTCFIDPVGVHGKKKNNEPSTVFSIAASAF